MNSPSNVLSWILCATSGPSIDVQLSETGVVVTVVATGANAIRIILRDSSNRRHTQYG